ncbi:MAG: glycoside hydrolase [Acidobacteria bacterium]|nr:glycoside hydrolase [Acidobacteriota bacterium]
MRSISSDRAGVLALALVFTLALTGTVASASSDSSAAAPTLHRPAPRDRASAEPSPAAPDGSAPDAAPFADLPANEIDVQASMPRAPGFDLGPVAFGRTTGQLCVLAIDNLSLYAVRSTDGGKTFAAPVLVAGGAGQPDVLAFAGALSSGGKLYVAYVVADPAGGLGLRFTRSADVGLTWVAPVTLVASGEESFNVSDVAISAGPADRVAVTWLGGGSTDPWVRGSTNAGVSWSAAVRVDAGVAAGTYPARDPDIDIDGTGNVFVAYLQNRDGATKVWTARSLNAGATFQPEVTLGSGSGEGAGAPDVEVTNDGKILIAFWDGELSNSIRVFRSTNQGSTYTQVLNQDLGAPDNKQTVGPFVYNSAGTSVVLLAFIDPTGTVKLHRSADYGATWGASQTMTTTAVPAGSWGGVPSLGAARTSGGNWLIAWTDARVDAYADQKSDVWLRRSGTGGTSWDAEKRVDLGSAEGAAQSAPLSITDTLSNDVFLVYGDARDDQRSLNLYSNRSLSSPINFTADKRIDTDPVAVDPKAFDDVVTATDGAGRVYVAFSSVGTGPSSDIYVAASDDGGFSYETPVRVGGTTAGQRIAAAPAIAASSDGRVYLAYTLDTETQREVRFNRSADFGSTWQGSDVVLGSFATPPGNYGIDGIPGLQLIAQSGGTMYLAWATFDTVYLTRSFNGGVTLDTRDVDQDTRGFNHYPALCANGNRLVLAMVAPDNALAWYSIWAASSDNRGDSWSTRVWPATAEAARSRSGPMNGRGRSATRSAPTVSPGPVGSATPPCPVRPTSTTSTRRSPTPTPRSRW